MPKNLDICVVGAGPAGSVLATRLAQFGHRVGLVERAPFPRRQLGESLTPGVMPLLASLGAGPRIRAAQYPQVTGVRVRWDSDRFREDPQGGGMLVDRGHFDQQLLEHARGCGVQVRQPATVESHRHPEKGWNLIVSSQDHVETWHATMLADATGRNGYLPRQRQWTGPRTLALHAYGSGQDLPTYPMIEAGPNAWYWGVPLPGGEYNTLVFLDPQEFRSLRGKLLDRFRSLLSSSSLPSACLAIHSLEGVRACDATPYLDRASVTGDTIKVGDAALALDPIASSGVQRALQSALAGSVVVHTLLHRPQAETLARHFYMNHLSEASRRHQIWARSHYATVAAQRPGQFWQARARGVTSPDELRPEPTPLIEPDSRLGLSPQLEFVETPCIVDRFIEARPAVCHPSLEGPVAYLGECEVAPLLRKVRDGMTARELVQAWTPRVSPLEGRRILQWLASHGLLGIGFDVPITAEGRPA